MTQTSDYESRVAALSGDRQLLLARLRQRSAPSLPAPGRRPDHLVRAPLSPMQELLWLVCQKLPPGDPLRNITIAAQLDGPLDVEALRYAVDRLVADNESLRTVFGSVGGVPYQVVTEPKPADFAIDDVTSLPEADRPAAAWELVNERDLHGAFDLAAGPLFRARLIRLGEDRHVLSVSVHHTVCDGAGTSLICAKLAAIYAARLSGGVPALPQTLGQADFAWWQRQHYLHSAEMARHLDYWREQLRGSQPARLPSARPRPTEQTYEGTYYKQPCSEDLRDLLATVARNSGASPLMVLVAAFAIVVAQLSGRHDFVFATDTPGRDRTEFEDVIGMFVNVLMLRMDTSGDPTFAQMVQRARNVLLDAWTHRAVPAPEIVKAVRPDAPRDVNPLSSITMQYLEQHTGAPGLYLPGLRATPLNLVLRRARRDLSLSLIDFGDAMEFWAEYSTDLFDEEQVRDMLTRLDRVLHLGAAHPDRPVFGLS